MNARSKRVAADLIKTQWWTAALFWIVLYAIYAAIAAIVALTAGLDQSAWIGARYWPQYIVFVYGALLTSLQLRIYIGHGISRRAFVLGGTVYGIAMAALFGVGLQLGFVIERGIFNLAGIEQFPDTNDLAASPLRNLTSTLELTALFSLYFFAGWVIASAFYRLGVSWGVVSILPSLFPALFMEYSMWDQGPIAAAAQTVGRPTMLLTLGVVSLVALVLASQRLLHDVPIKSK